ncbi:MAG: hypothetical protein ACUVWO_00375 [Thermodesulfobacteriota bacterium]
MSYSKVVVKGGESIETYAACPDEKKLLGGGGGVVGITSISPFSSRPSMVYNGPAPDGKEEWIIIWHNPREGDLSPVDILVYAICGYVSQ